jgi:CBS domain-containing protein
VENEKQGPDNPAARQSNCGLYLKPAGNLITPRALRQALRNNSWQKRLPEHLGKMMKVADILRVKGNTLYTVQPDEPLAKATAIMAEKDIGSLVVMEHGDLVGMLTFREVLTCLVINGGEIGRTLVRKAMDDHPMTCTPDTEIDEVRRMMLERHARYMPVMSQRMLMGVISFYDVAKAVVDSQNFENKMLKAYIRDWPAEDGAERD